MKIRPLYDRIVVKRIEEKEQMQGGLYIPDTAKEKPQEGEVVAVGKGKRLEDGKVVALDVQVGDRILCFSSDYPHPEGTRDPIGRFEATMAGLDEAARERFYAGNFATLMGGALAR